MIIFTSQCSRNDSREVVALSDGGGQDGEGAKERTHSTLHRNNEDNAAGLQAQIIMRGNRQTERAELERGKPTMQARLTTIARHISCSATSAESVLSSRSCSAAAGRGPSPLDSPQIMAHQALVPKIAVPKLEDVRA